MLESNSFLYITLSPQETSVSLCLILALPGCLTSLLQLSWLGWKHPYSKWWFMNPSLALVSSGAPLASFCSYFLAPLGPKKTMHTVFLQGKRPASGSGEHPCMFSLLEIWKNALFPTCIILFIVTDAVRHHFSLYITVVGFRPSASVHFTFCRCK